MYVGDDDGIGTDASAVIGPQINLTNAVGLIGAAYALFGKKPMARGFGAGIFVAVASRWFAA
jgi:hypothetical protein